MAVLLKERTKKLKVEVKKDASTKKVMKKKETPMEFGHSAPPTEPLAAVIKVQKPQNEVPAEFRCSEPPTEPLPRCSAGGVLSLRATN